MVTDRFLMAKSRVQFPDGTVVEIANDTPVEQITAILTALKGQVEVQPSPEEPTSGELIEPELTAEEIWEQGSKKEKLALFIRNHFMEGQWFSTIEVRDQQLQFVKRLIFGESPAIATYLNRLHEDVYLQKKKISNKVRYSLTSKIIDKYPELHLDEVASLLQNDI